MKMYVWFLIALSTHVWGYEYQISIAAIFQDEAAYLSEWLDYHRMMGVEHFYLYNNLSSDNWEEILEPYINAGIVEVREWPYAADDWEGWKPIQNRCFDDAIAKARGQSKWLALIDTDEFICPLEDVLIPQFLDDYEEYAGVVVWWQCFGTSGVEKLKPGELLIEKLTACAPSQKRSINGWYKTICQPKRISRVVDVHILLAHYPYNIVDEKKNRAQELTKTKIQLNHYWSRDRHFLETQKLPRHLRWGNTSDSILEREKAMNLSKDFAILPKAAKLKRWRKNHPP